MQAAEKKWAEISVSVPEQLSSDLIRPNPVTPIANTPSSITMAPTILVLGPHDNSDGPSTPLYAGGVDVREEGTNTDLRPTLQTAINSPSKPTSTTSDRIMSNIEQYERSMNSR